MNDILIKVNNLNVGLSDGNVLLKDINFDIQRGETFALLGESGSGKSLTALSIARLLTDNLVFQSGEIWLDGQDLLQLPEISMRQIRGRQIAFIFQEPTTAMNPVMTAGQQIIEVLKLHHAMRLSVAKQATLDLLLDVGLTDTERVFASYPHQLSGGMKQRVMIAMALAGEPDLLIADEPTTALDVTVQAQILDLLKSLQTRLGMTMLFISHDLSLISNIADRLAVMQNGQITDIATPRNFFRQPKHSYSQHLIDVVPTIDKRGHPLSGQDFSTASVATSKEILLEVNDLQVYFPTYSGLFNRVSGEVKAVDGVSFSLPQGQTLALIGESGSGKTTVAKAILSLVAICGGSVYFSGRRIDALKQRDLLTYRRKMQIVWQDPFSSLNPKMTIGEIIKEGIPVQNYQQVNRRITALLREVGFDSGIIHRYPHEFSGGQRQRICIARALAVEPELLICDEPTSALDVSVQAQILDLFQNLQRTRGLSYLFITHDIATVSYIAHSIAILRHGKIIEQGAAVSILNAPRETYTKTLFSSVPVLKVA